jgi:hypothetical protein
MCPTAPAPINQGVANQGVANVARGRGAHQFTPTLVPHQFGPVVLCLLLQYLIQSCGRGGRRIVEDMCYEIRRAEEQKIGAELHVYLEEGTYHKRLFRGPNTNDMKK